MCPHSLLLVLDSVAVATTIGSLASASESAMEGITAGMVKAGEPSLPGEKGAGGERSPCSHLGDARAAAKGSSLLRHASHACGSASPVLPVIQSGQSRRNHVESVTKSQ